MEIVLDSDANVIWDKKSSGGKVFALELRAHMA